LEARHLVLTIDKAGWKILEPQGATNFIDVAYFSGGRLQARGGIVTTLNSRVGGNGWCPDLAPDNYRWAVSADTLTLTHAVPTAAHRDPAPPSSTTPGTASGPEPGDRGGVLSPQTVCYWLLNVSS
jgi:hypothetical protein